MVSSVERVVGEGRSLALVQNEASVYDIIVFLFPLLIIILVFGGRLLCHG